MLSGSTDVFTYAGWRFADVSSLGYPCSPWFNSQSNSTTTNSAIRKNRMPPCRCRFPCRNPGSTRVPSNEMMKIRSPFLAIERGIAARTTTVFRQKDRRNRCASTILVTINIRLERKLLHSCATSRVNPGIDNMIPSCETGIPKAENSTVAESADPCCHKATILFKAGAGIGTNQSKKQRGNTNSRAMRVPKQSTKDPIHQITIASMLTES